MEKCEAIAILRAKANELGRLPVKSDFTPIEISKIKAKLGPWNRALEQAELKEVSALYISKIKNKREGKNL